MQIKWYGHACFLLTSNSGVKVLTDPFDKEVGYPVPQMVVDIITTSHEHSDHNNVKMASGKFTLFNQPGNFSANGVEIHGVLTAHDEAGGTKRGKNIIYKFAIDGMNICHCGDLGHILTKDQIMDVGDVDILLIPTGGCWTIDSMLATEVVKQLNPRVIIPMHFKTDAFNLPEFPIDDADKFLKVMGGGIKLAQQKVEFSKENLNQYAGVLVLNYKG